MTNSSSSPGESMPRIGHPIEAYLSMGTQKLRGSAVPMLEALGHEMAWYPSSRYKTAYYYGWLAHELADIAESRRQPEYAYAMYDKAITHWRTAYDQTERNQPSYRYQAA